MDATSNELADTEVLAQLVKRRQQNKKISKVKKKPEQCPRRPQCATRHDYI
jgi:hypothetical protein